MRRPTSRAGRAEGREAGYTYLSVLAVLAAMAVAAQTTWIPAESERLRDAEAELLFRGRAYARAIESWRRAGNGSLPPSLEALLDDPREPGRRHIRRLYEDPMGGGWTLIRGADGGVAGVASSSGAAPRRRAFFPPGLEEFRGAEAYSDWVFGAAPGPAEEP